MFDRNRESRKEFLKKNQSRVTDTQKAIPKDVKQDAPSNDGNSPTVSLTSSIQQTTNVSIPSRNFNIKKATTSASSTSNNFIAQGLNSAPKTSRAQTSMLIVESDHKIRDMNEGSPKEEKKQNEKTETKNTNSKVSSGSMFASNSSQNSNSKQTDKIEHDPNAGLNKFTK